jgi:hypothetical protein
MSDKQKKEFQDPEVILQAAIEELDVFTQSAASRLDVGKDGRIVAAKETRLERVMGLARCYIGPLFSDQVRQEQEKKLGELKRAILQARDIIQSHSALIEKFKEGDDSQRKLAEYALLAIQRYNAVVAQGYLSGTIKYDVYNYERHCLLLDQEIKGQQIELPHTVSIKYESHPDAHPAHKMLKELSQTLLIGAVKKTSSIICPTHKKTLQFMIDTFHMKAIRLMQSHLSQHNSMAEILQLVKQTTLEIDEESGADLINMRQLIEVGPGFFILVTGCFKRNLTDPKFMTMPLLDSFRLSFQLTHSGFPFPSQHTGWALADKWVEAYPLRADQVPLFQQVDQRKKRLNQQLLFDQAFIQKARQYAKLKREVFDQHRDIFLPWHRQLQHALKQSVSKGEETDLVLEAFYQEATHAPSAFDLLVQTQQQLLDLFIREPMKALQEEWLGAGSTPLRIGSSQEKFQIACQRLERYRDQAKERLDPNNSRHAYILQQGILLGKTFQSIGLQYQSEKMRFSPPLLNDFERRLQACAFQQLLSFMDECEQRLDVVDPDQIKEDLVNAWSTDLKFFVVANIEEEACLPIALIDELEVYFNSRFYAFHPRQSEKIV